MNWFKHDTDATQDAKVKKLLIHYGAVGYAIYFHCLELIAGDVTEANLTFELEHDSEVIADNLHIKGTADKSGVMIVEEIMRFIVDLGLFTCSENKIFCLKLLKRLDSSMTSRESFRQGIARAKLSHDEVMTDHDLVMLDKIRLDKKRKDNKQKKTGRGIDRVSIGYRKPINSLSEYSQDFTAFYDSYPRKEGKTQAAKTYSAKMKQGADPAAIMAALGVYKAQIAQKHTEPQYIKQPSTFLNCFEDFTQQAAPKIERPIEYVFRAGKICPYCKEALPKGAHLCPKCGAGYNNAFDRDRDEFFEVRA